MTVEQLLENLPNIENRVFLAVFKDSGDDHSVVIKPSFEVQGSRLFVVGLVPSEVLPGFEGTYTALAWDAIQHYFLFDSFSDYQEARDKYLSDEASSKGLSSYFSKITRG